MSFLNASQLYKAAAGLYAISSPGHIFLGFDAIYPALKTIKASGKNDIGRRGAENCWNYVAVSLAIASLLNWQWSRTGGPSTPEENNIFWLIVGMHAVNGFRYAQVGAYGALGPMWIAPLLSILAKYQA